MQNPNPYTPPAAPVDPATEPTVPRSLLNLLRGLVVAQIVALPLLMAAPERLPVELQASRDHYHTLFLTAHPLATIVFMVVMYASLVALWWEKRWAAWAFLGACVASEILELTMGPRIYSDIVGLLDSLTDASAGATLVVLYLMGMLTPHRTGS
jgi:hypothetical protein